MDIFVTEFVNPFSFFCIPAKEKVSTNKNITPETNSYKPLDNIRPVDHGQYVAVLHECNWVRAIVSLEDHLLFWLVDYGYYLRPNEKTVFVDLPTQYKRLPSKVFEASLHGVAPVDKIMDINCEIVNQTSTKWIKAAIEKCKELIDQADKHVFVPTALVSSKHNDVVIGELYLLDKKLGGFVSLVDELEKWPVFLERNKEFYIQNLQTFYKNRRMHHACPLKPELSNVPTFDITTLTVDKYNAICETIPKLEVVCEDDTLSDSGQTYKSMELSNNNNNCSFLKLTAEEVKQYSKEYIVIGGERHNRLTILINKARELEQCNYYKNKQSVGRANTRAPRH